jgi:transposase
VGKYRSHSIQFKKQVALDYLEGRGSLRELAERYGLEKSLVRLWAKKHEAGEYDDDSAQAVVIEEYERRIAELERKVGQLTMELEFAKRGARSKATASGPENLSIISGPAGSAGERGVK